MSPNASGVVTVFLSQGSLALSRSVSRVQTMLGSGNYHAADLAALMQTDPTLTAAVMAVANSTYFSRQPCEGIGDAVNRLGSVQLSRIFAQVLARSAMMAPLGAYNLAADGIWKRAVHAAVAAEMIAARQAEDRAAAYMVGLLHQIGKLVTNNLWKAQNRAAALKMTDFDREYSDEEISRYRFDHPTLGAELLKQLSFPESTYRAIGRQYQVPSDPLSTALYVGRLTRAICCDSLNPVANPEIMQRLDLGTAREFSKFLNEVREETANRIQGN